MEPVSDVTACLGAILFPREAATNYTQSRTQAAWSATALRQLLPLHQSKRIYGRAVC